jgi:hypothetical protein
LGRKGRHGDALSHLADVSIIKNTEFWPGLRNLDGAVPQFRRSHGWVAIVTLKQVPLKHPARRKSMSNREQVCTRLMYLCFTMAALIVVQGLGQRSSDGAIAHRGSGRVEVAARP